MAFLFDLSKPGSVCSCALTQCDCHFVSSPVASLMMRDKASISFMSPT